jgi:hypothetical protein
MRDCPLRSNGYVSRPTVVRVDNLQCDDLAQRLFQTGWQQNETCLTPSSVSPLKAFGLLFQWNTSATINSVHGFPTPTIFQGQVYMGTDKEVNVFGLCSTLANGCIN